MAPAAASPKSPLTGSPSGSPTGGYATPRSACGSSPAAGTPSSLQASPKTRGSLTRGFENRFGAAIFQGEGGACSPRSPAPAATPRSARKQGLNSFTDPTNPFARSGGKQITRPEDHRGDGSRAGSRSNHQGHMPSEQPGAQRSGDVRTPQDGRNKLVVHCYGGQNWRPGKAATNGGHRSPRCSEGVNSLLVNKKGGSVLENYLNDMKRSGGSRRPGVGTPSEELQRMNDVSARLPAERRAERARSHSVDIARSPRGFPGAESDNEDTYGFARKRSVDGRWTAQSCRSTMLHHENGGESTPMVTPRSTRQTKADQRFEEITAHMKAKLPEAKSEGKAIKASDRTTEGLLQNESWMKYPVA